MNRFGGSFTARITRVRERRSAISNSDICHTNDKRPDDKVSGRFESVLRDKIATDIEKWGINFTSF